MPSYGISQLPNHLITQSPTYPAFLRGFGLQFLSEAEVQRGDAARIVSGKADSHFIVPDVYVRVVLHFLGAAGGPR